MVTKVAVDSGTSLAVLVSDYLADCRARGLSSKTIAFSYGYPLLKVFLPWAEKEGIETPADLSDRLLNRLSSQLLEEGGARGPLSRHSVATYLRSVRQFLAWAQRQGEAPPLKVQQVKTGRRLLEVLSREEIDRMEAATPFERNKVLIRILADCGLRAGEAVGLREGDLVERKMGRNEERYLRVVGKGDLAREVPIPPDLYRRVRGVLRQRPPAYQGSQVFVSLHTGGSKRPVRPLTVSGVEQIVRDAADRAGIGRRVYPHLLRHSFATEQLRRGTNPLALARMLGHTSLAMITNVYSHLNSSDLYKALMDSL